MDFLFLDSLIPAANADTLPPAPDTFTGQVAGGIVWAVTMIALGCYGLYKLFKEKDRAERMPPEEKLTVGALELADTAALRKDIDLLSQQLRVVVSSGVDRTDLIYKVDQKIDGLVAKIQHLENEQEVDRRARERVAQLLAEKERDRGS